VISVWRITKRKHARTAFSGGGARKYGGRWNSPGTAVVYTSETQSLAVLEMLVHLDGPYLLQEYVLIGVEIEESSLQDVDPSRLPSNWKTDPGPPALRKIGDEWVLAGSSVALRVPSILVPAERNVLLNPVHPDFLQVTIGKPVAFTVDPRLTI
jgi:RES domain-containing protein